MPLRVPVRTQELISLKYPAERLLWPGRASPSAPQLLAFSPGQEQAAGVWETCLATLRWGRAPGKPSLAGACWAQTEDVNLLCANPEMSSKEVNEHLDLRAQNTGWGGSAELLSALPGGSLCPLQPAPQDLLSEGPQLPNNHFPLGV